jgi:UDP-N-acetylglucosamine:LPS N-acetylglucosamine transferase
VKFRHKTVILSGPEPQKGILKDKLVAVLKDKNTKTVVFEGLPGKSGETGSNGGIIFYSHLPASAMKKIIKTSEKIITRSGYTTLMELVSMNCTALIIPTPGQTEQEYLAEYLSDKGWFSTIAQKEINAGLSFSQGEPIMSDKINSESRILLIRALNELLEDGHKKS